MRIGKLGATRTVLNHFEEHGLDYLVYVHRYEFNDWGDLGDEDKHLNNMEMFALEGHVLARYDLPTGESIYIETCWNQEERNTMVMFVDER